MASRSILLATMIGALILYSGCSTSDGTSNPGGGGSGTGATGGNGGGNGGVAGTPITTGGSAGVTAGGAGAGGGSGGQGGGAAGSAGASGGGSGGGGPAPVTPTEAGGVYTFSYGDVVFKVNAMVGGRITSFSKGGVEVLDSTDAVAYGSTFWPSPQNWSWPPAPEIDTAPFTATLEGATLVLTGPTITAASLNVSIGKRFTVDSSCECVDIVYSLTNAGAAAVNVAPWEVTRVDTTGIALWPAPAAPHQMTGALAYTYDAAGQITWFDHAAQPDLTGGELDKIFQDGATWLALAQGSLLFLKSFPDITSAEAATGEGQIEIYTNDGKTYTELENQGAYGSIAAGASVTYDVRWYLRSIPATVTVASGSQTLFDFAAGLAQ